MHNEVYNPVKTERHREIVCKAKTATEKIFLLLCAFVSLWQTTLFLSRTFTFRKRI